MRKNYLLVPTLIASSLLVTACNDDDSPKNTTDNSIPQLSAAEPATLNLCSELISQYSFENTVITASELVTAGEVAYSSTESYIAPEHCVVSGYMNERMGNGIAGEGTADYAIGFEMRLPTDWNGRFYYQANGGLDGSVSKAVGRLVFSSGSELSALNKGFAVISSDAGHPSPTPLFGFDHQARLDYGYNAVAELTPMAKSLIEKAYGKQPDRSYFAGCSNGGRHAMVAASRYSDLYDGFIAGNPGLHLPQAASTQLYGVQQYSKLVSYNEDGTDILATLQTAVTQDEFSLIAQNVLDKCDAFDGVTDGMVANTYACQAAFDLQTDVPTCTGERDGTCLSAEQKQVLHNIMSGPRESNTGEAIYADFPYDAGMGSDDWFKWEYFMALNRDPGAVGFIFSSPPTPFNGESESGSLAFVQSFDINDLENTIYNTTSEYPVSGDEFMKPLNESDLSTLKNRGAKMIVFHGTSDAVFSTNDTVNWYNTVDSEDADAAQDYTRLFLIPGMGHCGRGPTADKFDMVDAIVNWVEQGEAPAEITAAVRAENTELPEDWSKSRTRILCPYPQFAQYNGTGDIEDAANFSCVIPE